MRWKSWTRGGARLFMHNSDAWTLPKAVRNAPDCYRKQVSEESSYKSKMCDTIVRVWSSQSLSASDYVSDLNALSCPSGMRGAYAQYMCAFWPFFGYAAAIEIHTDFAEVPNSEW